MRRIEDFLFDASSMPGGTIPAVIVEKVFAAAWRLDLTQPGFCVIDLGASVNSHDLRSRMLALKDQLNEVAERRLIFRSMARFDQQVTTKFHLDGAPAESMLMLGYEQSNVESRLFLADYTHAAFDLGITPQQFSEDFNPMFKKGEELLLPYTTELPQPAEGHSRILLVNNSHLPFAEARTNSLDVMHKAVIVTPNEAERRIINSTMLVTEGEEISIEKQEEFVMTDKISQKTY